MGGDDVRPAAAAVSAPVGSTPLTRSVADERIWLKREDQNPTGSHKDRAAQHQLRLSYERGDRAVTISSSGNAAIATSRAAASVAIPAVVFVHPATDPEKLAAIDGSTTIVVVTERAINGAKHLSRTLDIPNLRSSTNDDAVDGYDTLGDELATELPPETDVVVVFATSGASALAIARVLHERRPAIAVHVVQGAGNTGIVAPDAPIDDASAHAAAAGRLGVRRSRRAREVMRAVTRTGGAGHVVTAAEVAAAREQLHRDGIVVSDESAGNFAVARQLANVGHTVCCIISGAPAQATGSRPPRVEADNEHDALTTVCALLGIELAK
ncbi:MAG: Pyridoxal-5-phosphate-dependent protein beta subunit [Thermoleophilia bacterium]|nr:Pyridoxal-5-phosphate-dependent protein beta subunit [Thermoleophilia bacterium]